MSIARNMIAIGLGFFGPIPDLAKAKIDSKLDRVGVGNMGMTTSATWRHELDSSGDCALDYWDRGFDALLGRLGGADVVTELGKQAQNSSFRTVHFQRESMEPDEVDGAGPFSYTSDYATISLSDRTVLQIGAMGFGINVTHRLTQPYQALKT